MSKTFRGKTEDAGAPFLGAPFWKQGVKVAGKVVRTFSAPSGPCYVLRSLRPVTVDGEDTEEVCVGNLTGFRMALQASGLESLVVGDLVHVECTGVTPTEKGSPRPNFEIEVTRD